MTLFGWELIKILKRRMTRVILAVSLVLAAGSALFLGFSNYSFGVEVAAPPGRPGPAVSRPPPTPRPGTAR